MNTESARARLLKAGFKMLGSGMSIDSIRLLELTRTAGVSNGAFYHAWPDGLEAYVRDLAAYALDWAHQDYLKSIMSALGEADPEDLNFREVVRLQSKADTEGLDGDPSFRAQVGLWPRAYRDADVRAELRRQYQKYTRELYTPMYTDVLQGYGLTVRPPFTVSTVAVMLTALTEGLTLRRAVDAEALELPESLVDEGWEAFGALAYCLLGVLLKPTSSPDTRTALQVADDLLSEVTPDDKGRERAALIQQYDTELRDAMETIEHQLVLIRQLRARLRLD
ncbi:hypothetical protein GCM10027596_24330 [Nocardioides korecus]